MQTRLGNDSEEVLEALAKHREQGRFTIFSLVDALTRIAGEEKNAGDRVGADVKAARLLQLVS